MQEDKSSTGKVEIKFQKVGEREKIKPKGAIPLLVWLLLASGVGAGVGQVISSLLGGWLEAKGIQTRMGLAQEKNVKEKLAEISSNSGNKRVKGKGCSNKHDSQKP
jgi:hypothetical protein